MADNITTIHELKEKIKLFMQERDWHQFHNPKNISMSIAAEAAELMEFFLWIDGNQSYEVCQKKRDQVEQEVADVAILLLNFCERTQIDLAEAIMHKMKINAQKYPIEKAKGRTDKYTDL